MTGHEPRFLVDSMLGKVARWLILLGYDARFAGSAPSDLELLELARRDDRMFVTRDTKIPQVAGLRRIVVRDQRFEEQLKQVLSDSGLKPDPARLFSRCTWCNRALEAVPREEALPLVPPLVRELGTPFFRCPGCRRMYWNGAHTERTKDKLKRMGLWA